jgi:UDP-2,3-diacylglucosamine pyrophosphatase LpxH
MLVAISDLHLVDETAGRHNFAAAAFTNVFFPHLVSIIRSKNARELKLVLLGDTFDFLHTDQWFEEAPVDRPWGANGLADIPTPRPGSRTCSRTLSILGQLPADGRRESVPENTILFRNWESLAFIRTLGERLREELGYEIEFQLIYLTGNHDRIVNLYPELRSAVARILGVTPTMDVVEGDPDGEWWFKNEYVDHDYGILARHGHQFDVWNYGGGERLTREAHLEVPIGDVLGVEFGARLPHEIAQHREENAAITDEVMHQMQAIALVRPFTHALQWLTYQIKSDECGDVRGALNASLRRSSEMSSTSRSCRTGATRARARTRESAR